MPKSTENQALKQVRHHTDHLFYAVTDALSIGIPPDELMDELEDVLAPSDSDVLPAVQALIEAIAANWGKAKTKAAAITATHAQGVTAQQSATEVLRNNALVLAEADEKVRVAQFHADNLRKAQRLKGLGI